MQETGTATITTNDGKTFDYVRPDLHEFSIRDIAASLARICRFGGHLREGVFYSVAEHSVRVSRLCPPELAFAGLMHDSAEAFVGDVVAPLKNMPEMVGYRIVEKRVEEALGKWFGVELTPMHPVVKEADQRMRRVEQTDLRDCNDVSTFERLYLPKAIDPWPIVTAERAFLGRYVEVKDWPRGETS